jgi:hypothetical protein
MENIVEFDIMYEKRDASGRLTAIFERAPSTGEIHCQGNYTREKIAEISSRYIPANSFGRNSSVQSGRAATGWSLQVWVEMACACAKIN